MDLKLYEISFFLRTALFWVITRGVVVISYQQCGTDRLSQNIGNKLSLLAV